MSARTVALLAVLLAPAMANAEAGWLTSRGRLLPQTRLEAWGGPRSVGVGVLRPDAPGATAGLGVEVAWILPDRVATLRVGRAWQLTRVGLASVSTTLGAAGWVVPEAALDLGLGPHAGLALSLGGDVFSVDLGLQTGVELFVRQVGPRLPQRAQLGLTLRLGDWAVSTMARLGADLLPGRGFVGRGELVVSLSWLGLERLPRAP